MKTFFRFLIGGHPFKAIRSLWTSPEMMMFDELDSFSAQVFEITAGKGFSKKQIRKDIKRLRKGLPRTTLSLGALDRWVIEDNNSLMTTLLKPRGSLLGCTSEKVSGVLNACIIDSGTRRGAYRSLLVEAPMWDDLSLSNRLNEIVDDSWLTLLRRTGRVPTVCPFCEDDELGLTSDLICIRCDSDIDIVGVKKIPTTRQKFKEIIEYEQSEVGKPIFIRNDIEDG